MVTIQDLARASGTSKSTVSRVINHDPNVKEETRKRVEQAIRELNYKPNFVARSMITGSLPLVMVTVGDIQNHYFAQTLVGIEKALTRNGYMAVVYNSTYEIEKEKAFIHLSQACNFSGIIPMTGYKSNELEKSLKECGCPVVLVNRYYSGNEFDQVYGNDFQSGYSATRELISMGYQNIVHLSGNSRVSKISAERERGFCQAMQESGQKVRKNMIMQGNLTQLSGFELAKTLLKDAEKPVAICSNNFLMGLGVMDYARKAGLTIRKDYDLAICEMPPELYMNSDFIYAGPQLSEMGEMAANLLLNRIRNPESETKSVVFSSIVTYHPNQNWNPAE